MESVLTSCTMTEDDTTRTMKDVSHTPPAGVSVTNVWQRGRNPEASDAATPADD
jgi:hypothetical protein